MLDVTFYCDEHGRYRGFSANGHADFDEHGQDVVCAAVSAILQAARLGLERYARITASATQAAGQLELTWSGPDSERESVLAIVTTADLALEEIARLYPAHVRLSRAAVR